MMQIQVVNTLRIQVQSSTNTINLNFKSLRHWKKIDSLELGINTPERKLTPEVKIVQDEIHFHKYFANNILP